MPKADQLPSGKWRTRVFIGTVNGVKKHETFIADTEDEANYLALEYKMKSKAAREQAKKPILNRLTLREAYAEHINNCLGVLSPTTIRRYKTDSCKFFTSIMDMHLCDLTQPDIQKAVSLDSRRYAPKSIHNAHGLLSAVLSVYHPEFQLKTNLPQMVEPDLVVPEDADIKRMLNRIAGSRLEVAVILAACAGLRRSEICGLMPADIDVDKSTIKIVRVMVKDEHGKWVIKNRPKTAKSKRVIEVAPFIIKKLLQLDRHNEFLVGYVPDSISKMFIDLRDELDIKCRFHDLRHYNASIMHALGVPDKYAMERMGHSTTDMLKKVYQHVMSDKKKEVNDSINNHMDEFFRGDC